MDGYVSLNVEAQLARYKKGLTGGPFNKVPYTPPPITFVEGNPSFGAGLGLSKVPDMVVTDTWYGRVTARK